MNQRNYQKELDKVIDGLVKEERVPRLLLHSCCAPCSSYVLEYLSQYFEITILFYNPNIYPPEEYQARVHEEERLISEMPFKHPVHMISGTYDPDVYYAAVKGLEKEPEGGERCAVCFALRLAKTAQLAAEGGYDYFSTTLTISPLKDAARLNRIGGEMGAKYGVMWLPSDFKKKDGYKRSIELSHRFDLYRQNYCGCRFSRQQRELQEQEMER